MPNCPLCEKVFRKRGNLSNHLISHTKEKPHKCLTCSASFGHFQTLNKHIQIIHEGVKAKTWAREKKLKCSMCSFKCAYGQALEIHVRKHSAERPFACEIPGCDFKTKYKGVLQQHFRNVHSGQRSYECTSEGCNYKTSCGGNLRRHLKTHSKEKPFVCKMEGCKYDCKYKSSLESHIYLVHSDKKPFKCSVCDFRTKYKNRLRQHQDEHANIKRFRCQAAKCSFATTSRNSLRVHLGRKHTKKDFICAAPGCNFRCGTNGILKEHTKKTHSPPISKCPVDSCNFSTRVLRDLRLHMSRKHKDLQAAALLVPVQPDLQTDGSADILSCTFPKCGYQTEFQHRYDRHIKTHDEEVDRKYICKFCQYRCTTYNGLQSHIKRRHLGEKTYSCSLCNYTTVCSTELRIHAGKIHHVHVIPRRQGNQLMKRCRICNRKFFSYSEFVLHSMTHLKPVVVLQRLKLNVK